VHKERKITVNDPKFLIGDSILRVIRSSIVAFSLSARNALSLEYYFFEQLLKLEENQQFKNFNSYDYLFLAFRNNVLHSSELRSKLLGQYLTKSTNLST
jgi:hypothetical protein